MLFLAAAPAYSAWVDAPTNITGLPSRANQPGALTPGDIDPEELKPSYRTSLPRALEKTDGALYVDAQTVANYFEERSAGYDELQKLPLFKIPAEASFDVSPDAVVVHPLEAFEGRTPADLNVVKVLGPEIFMAYSPAFTAQSVAGRTFAVISSDASTVMGEDELIEEGCFIALCVSAGDIFFNVGSEGVVDPAFIYTGGEPVPTLTPSPVPTIVPGPVPLYPQLFESELPLGIGVARNVSFPRSASESGLRRDAAEIVVPEYYGGYLALHDIVIRNILDANSKELDNGIALRLPVVRAEVTYSRRTGIFMMDPSYLPGASVLSGRKVGDIRFIKAVSAKPSEARFFTLATSLATLSDGRFAVTRNSDGRPPYMSANEIFEQGRRYYLLFAIRDNGDFDANDDPLTLSDPCFIAVFRTGSPEQDNSVGCSAGSAAPAALLFAVPLVFFGRRW